MHLIKIFKYYFLAHAPAAVVSHSTIAHHPIGAPLGYHAPLAGAYHGGLGYGYGGEYNFTRF